MGLLQMLNNLFYKEEPQLQSEVLKSKKDENNKISCHYCGKLFEVTETLPVQVKLLYKDEHVTGKGAECPYCNMICIVG